MKFKVIFEFSGGSGRAGAANSEFYVYDEAVEAARLWAEIGAAYKAYLWDGVTWTTYTFIP